MTSRTPNLRIVRADAPDSEAARVPSAREVLDLIQQKHPNAAAALYDHVGPQVDATVWRLLGADADHDDIVHDVLCVLLEKAGQIRKADSLRGWVKRVTVNRVIHELRRRQVRRFRSPLESEPDNFPSGQGGPRTPQMAAVYRVLDQMPAKERVALTLRYFEQYSIDEVADALRCSRRTANRRISDATARFKRLASHYPELASWTVPE